MTVHALVTYTAKAGSAEELQGVLRTNIARLRELGLVSEKPHFVAKVTGREGMFVESFHWAHPGAEELARDHAESQELWMRVEDLCASIDRAILESLV